MKRRIGLSAAFAAALIEAMHLKMRREGLLLAFDARHTIAGGCYIVGIDPKPLKREIVWQRVSRE